MKKKGEPAALARQQTRSQLPDECTDSSRAPELAWRASCGDFSVYEGAMPLLTTPCWCAQSIEGQMTGSGPGDVALRLFEVACRLS